MGRPHGKVAFRVIARIADVLEGTSPEDIAKQRSIARSCSEVTDHSKKTQKNDQLLTFSTWSLQDLTKITFYPDKTPRVGLVFGRKVVTMLFLDDMSREIWRKTLLAQLSKIDEDATWARSYEGVGAVLPVAG